MSPCTSVLLGWGSAAGSRGVARGPVASGKRRFRAATSFVALVAMLGVGVVRAGGPLNESNVEESVGPSRFEASLMSLAKVGMYELAFTAEEIAEMVGVIQPFNSVYRETDENLVMLDEYPYVPEIWVSTGEKNVSVTLSNLVMDQSFDPTNVKVDINQGWQSLYFLDISFKATVDWKYNDRPACFGGFRDTDLDGPCGIGRATIEVPTAWLHQNIEAQCYQRSTSILSWESRCDLDVSNIDITTTYNDREMLDAFAEALHKSRILKKYLAIGLQHQLAKTIGSIHWASQSRLRDLCLDCYRTQLSEDNSRYVLTLAGDQECLHNVPNFFFNQNFGDIKDVQGIAAEAIKDLLKDEWVTSIKNDIKKSKKQSHIDNVDQLTPRVDPRKRFQKKQLPEGYVDPDASRKAKATPANDWKKALGQYYMEAKKRIG